MSRTILSGSIGILLCLPGYAALRPQRLLGIPAEPGQQIVDLKTDSQGNLIVAAIVRPPSVIRTSSSGAVESALRSIGLIRKIDVNGNEAFSRILPGLAPGRPALVLAIDSRDDIYVTGATSAPKVFPFTNALVSPGLFSGVFLVKFRGLDGTVAYAASLGTGDGLQGRSPASLAVDQNGQALIAMSGLVGAFSTTSGAYSSPPSLNESTQTFLIRLSTAGDSFVSVARYGGCDLGNGCADRSGPSTQASAILLDPRGNIWIAGVTNALDLPVTSDAMKPQCGCDGSSFRGFLAEFRGDGSQLIYASYVGTTANALKYNDVITSAALDRSGHIWVAGNVSRPDFPVTPNAIQKQFGGGVLDGFIAEYDPAANQMPYATYLGGEANDSITKLQIGSDGSVIVTGQAQSSALPMELTGFIRGTDFVANIDPRTYAISATKFPNGVVGSGMALMPGGSLAVGGEDNVVTFLRAGGDGSPAIFGVANSAGVAVTGQVAQYEIISLYGANIGPAAPAIADLSSGQAPTQLADVQVRVNGNPAPLLYAQNDQVNIIVPFAAQQPERILVNNRGTTSNEAVLGVVPAAPQAFKLRKNFAAALNQDGTVNGPDNPAKLGSVVSVFATGFGSFIPPLKDGSVVTNALPALLMSPEVVYFPAAVAPCLIGCLGGGPPQSLEVTYAGAAPTLIAGVNQVNFRLPPSAPIAFPNLPELSLQFIVGEWGSTGFSIFVK